VSRARRVFRRTLETVVVALVAALAAVVVPIAASTPARAQDWIVDDNPEFYDEKGDYSWFTPPANVNSTGYGTNGFRFTIAIGNDPREATDSWAQWDIGHVNGIYEIEVWIPSAWATAHAGYEVWEDSSRIDTAWINQQNVSGWQPLGTYDLGGYLRVSVYDAVAQDDYRTVGIANARLAVDALRMRRVDADPQPTPPPPPPSSAPGPPRNLSLVLTDADSFHIDWDPPSDDGGSPITEYGVAVQHAGSGDIAGWSTVGTSTSFDGVVGATYVVEVWAKNSQGSGPAQRGQITIPSTGDVPGPPRNLILTRAGSSGVRITWDAPANDGGSRVTRYSLSVWRPDGSTNSWTTTSTEYQFTGETGAFYTVSVVAENRHGPSIPMRESIYLEADEPAPPSPESGDGVPPVMDDEADQSQVRPPGPPRNLRLTLTDDDSFRITWEPPSDDGGAPVTSYTLEVSRPRLSSSVGPWSRTYAPRGRSFSFDGRKGATYTVKLVARNRAGISRSLSGQVATRDDDECSGEPEPPSDVQMWIDESSGERRLVAEWPPTVCTGSSGLLTHRVVWSRIGWESDAALVGGTMNPLRHQLRNPRYDTTYTVRIETINTARETSPPIQRSLTTDSDPSPLTSSIRCVQRVAGDAEMSTISALVRTTNNYAAEASAQMARSVAAANVVVALATDDESDLRSAQLGAIRRNTKAAEVASVWAHRAASRTQEILLEVERLTVAIDDSRSSSEPNDDACYETVVNNFIQRAGDANQAAEAASGWAENSKAAAARTCSVATVKAAGEIFDLLQPVLNVLEFLKDLAGPFSRYSQGGDALDIVEEELRERFNEKLDSERSATDVFQDLIVENLPPEVRSLIDPFNPPDPRDLYKTGSITQDCDYLNGVAQFPLCSEIPFWRRLFTICYSEPPMSPLSGLVEISWRLEVESR